MKIPLTISDALAILQKARCPEHIFGDESDRVAEIYRGWAKIVHEDRVPMEMRGVGKPAHIAFTLLQKLKDEADKKIDRGTYGDGKLAPIAVISTKTASYTLKNLLYSDDIADYYDGVNHRAVPILFKLVRNPRNNDLMKNEANILAELPAKLDPKHTGYFPNLLDSFEVEMGKLKTRANVFNFTDNAVSLAEVNHAFPDGLDPRDAAWMWNRMLEALHLLHVNGYVHGAITPDRFIVVPEAHTGCLIDLCYAVKIGSTVKAISPKWKRNYPSEILNKKPVDGSTDVYMAAHCFDFLVKKVDIPPTVGPLLKACWLAKAARTKSAQELYTDFKKAMKRVYGPRTFRVFNMPKTTNK